MTYVKFKNSFESFVWWCEVFKEPLSQNFDGAAKVDLLQRLQRAATDNACTSTRIFFPCKLILISEDYLDFCLRNCDLRDFSLF